MSNQTISATIKLESILKSNLKAWKCILATGNFSIFTVDGLQLVVNHITQDSYVKFRKQGSKTIVANGKIIASGLNYLYAINDVHTES